MTIKMIFQKVSPERITLGTLRFEPGFYNVRNKIFTTGTDLPTTLNGMKPMFDPNGLRVSLVQREVLHVR